MDERVEHQALLLWAKFEGILHLWGVKDPEIDCQEFKAKETVENRSQERRKFLQKPAKKLLAKDLGKFWKQTANP